MYNTMCDQNLSTIRSENSPEQHSPRSSSSTGRFRTLACTACQQRKVKCDRKFPCGNCSKHRTTCVPATRSQRRQRRPEQDLIAIICKYEELLHENQIHFEPTLTSSGPKATASRIDTTDVMKVNGHQGPRAILPRQPENSDRSTHHLCAHEVSLWGKLS